MKKTYIKPEMNMEVIESESMMAASDLTLSTSEAQDNLDITMEGKDLNSGDWGGLW